MCEVLEVSGSGFYDWRERQPSPRQRDDDRVTDVIRRLHRKSDYTYGSPRIHADLVEACDEPIGVNRVARLMRQAGLQGVSGRKRGPRTTTPPKQRPKPPDRVQRRFTASAPDRLWLGDITYPDTEQGWLYLRGAAGCVQPPDRGLGHRGAPAYRAAPGGAARRRARPPAGLRGC
jgi:putative transposase